VQSVLAERRPGKRKPGYRRHYPRLDGTARQEVTQARFDEYAVIGPHAARIERRKQQRPDVVGHGLANQAGLPPSSLV